MYFYEELPSIFKNVIQPDKVSCSLFQDWYIGACVFMICLITGWGTFTYIYSLICRDRTLYKHIKTPTVVGTRVDVEYPTIREEFKNVYEGLFG